MGLYFIYEISDIASCLNTVMKGFKLHFHYKQCSDKRLVVCKNEYTKKNIGQVQLIE